MLNKLLSFCLTFSFLTAWMIKQKLLNPVQYLSIFIPQDIVIMPKNIVMIGGSSGIGAALIQQLDQQGHQIFSISRTAQLPPGLKNVQAYTGDILNADLSGLPFPEAIDGVVYCPGSIELKPFRSLKPEQFLQDFHINVIGAVKTLQMLEKRLKKSGQASVVLFSTVAVGQGMPFHASIASAKGAVEGLCRSLAAEWAPAVRVNCIAPSLVDTPLASKLLANEKRREASDERHPLKRVGTPEDLASMANYLLSDQAAWITGQVIGVDGGMGNLKV